MCGIAAIFAYHDAAPEVDRRELRKIRDSMISRGPDGAGEWYSQDGRVGLAHRRLAIIDLSERGEQPMQSPDGNLVVSFNGEIYNYQELRSQLERTGRVFRSHSDTEVLLHFYAEKGEEMVHDLRGMFAFVLWDERKKTMLLVRDPYGIKPLYYADDGWTVRVASQVKALLQSDRVSKIPEPAGIVGFFLTGSVPEPYTPYQEIRQVPAGSTVSINSVGPFAPQPYFSTAKIFREAREQDTAQRNAAKDTVREALLDSVRHHFVSDVPVGVFLSAGIDSGSLVGLARDAGIQDLQTITLAFDEFRGSDQDEAPLAEKVAQVYSTKHHTRRVTRDEFEADLPRVLACMDQPSIDGVNTYFVSKAAKEMGLKVALSGLGGDEFFGGYPSFQEIPRLVSALAVPLRIPFLGDLFRRFVFPLTLSLSPFRGRGLGEGGIHPKFSGLFKYGGTYAGAYFLRRGLFMPWELESVLDKELSREGLRRLRLMENIRKTIEPDPGTPFGRVATLETSLYLRNQLLRDADWAGMAHSLEIRTPFVDACLLKSLAPVLVSTGRGEVSSSAGGATPSLHLKHLLTASLKTPLPDEIARRAKTGFTIPIDRWLERDGKFDGWREIPSLTRKNCPSARRWAYTVYHG